MIKYISIFVIVSHHWGSVGSWFLTRALQWRHNERDDVSNHQPLDCLRNRLFRHRWQITSKPRVTGICEGNSPRTGEFPAQRTSNAENASIWWRYNGKTISFVSCIFITVVAPSDARNRCVISHGINQVIPDYRTSNIMGVNILGRGM